MINFNAFIHEIPVGVHMEMEPVSRIVRTPAQLETVTRIVRSLEFAFATINPFPMGQLASELGSYRGPFTFAWYDNADRLHMTRIESDGSVNEADSFVG